MNKKTLLIVAGSVVVLALVGYFLAVPALQVSAYKDTVAKNQSELSDALNKLGAVLERDSFVKIEVDAGTMRSDAKVGNEAAANAEAKIAQVKKDLTSFNAFPLLDFNGKYKAAKELKANEEEYISKSEAFVKEMKGVLAYLDKNADLSAKMNEFDAVMSMADIAQTPEAYAAKITESVAPLQSAIDAFVKLTPPASLKDSHEYAAKAFPEFVDLYRQLAAALTNGDEAKLNELATQITAKGSEIVQKSDEYNAQFIRESELRKLDDSLNKLDRTISTQQANL